MLKVSTVNIEAGLSVPWNGREHIHRSSTVSTEASRRAIKSFYVVTASRSINSMRLPHGKNPSVTQNIFHKGKNLATYISEEPKAANHSTVIFFKQSNRFVSDIQQLKIAVDLSKVTFHIFIIP
ncbi:hypothetical protein TNCV_3117061 [Trichonephila clavipes]|nr:hypothetical protein TNCV_3117061 [Trichonephila clavipes]